MAGNHKELIVWRKAMNLTLDVYRCTKDLPREETYGLVAQMRRAAVSVPSNIAEGRGRYSNREMSRFLVNARGSLLELETQIEIARELGYLNNGESQNLLGLCAEVGRLINGTLSYFKEPVALS